MLEPISVVLFDWQLSWQLSITRVHTYSKRSHMLYRYNGNNNDLIRVCGYKRTIKNLTIKLLNSRKDHSTNAVGHVGIRIFRELIRYMKRDSIWRNNRFSCIIWIMKLNFTSLDSRRCELVHLLCYLIPPQLFHCSESFYFALSRNSRALLLRDNVLHSSQSRTWLNNHHRITEMSNSNLCVSSRK
jgi:hypothetical protein